MNRVLFLDIDGVLNGHEWCHLGKGIPRINPLPAKCLQIIIDSIDPKVVISSTWARHLEDKQMTTAGFETLLKTHGIQCNIIDGINGRIHGGKQRTEQITLYCQRMGISLKDILAIDDAALDFENHIRPNPSLGLQPHHVLEAKRIFGME